MNRSKIFLGVTATLLAIAGIAAAHKAKKPASVFYTIGDGKCILQIPTLYSLTGNNQTRLFIPVPGHASSRAYLTTDGNGTGVCVTPLYTGD